MTNEEFIKNISFEGEEWRDIKDFEGLYMISSCGRILSCSKEVMGGNGLRKTKPKLSIPGECRGYYQARLYKNNKQHCPYIHRLVAESFIPNPSNYKYVDHIDGNCTNNNVENLRWCTANMNRLNPITHEKHRKSMSKSKRLKIVKIKPIVRININNPSDVEAYLSLNDAIKDGFNKSGISECCHKKRYSHRGYKWYFLDEYQNLIKALDMSSPTKRKA